MKFKNKKAAMEMTIGTMVTIVLLVAVLVMILFFITRITESGTNAIDGVDAAIRTKIDKLFSSDSDKKIVIYPEPPTPIRIKKGNDDLGFGFVIRNTGEAASFSYTVTADEIGGECSIRLPKADKLIALGSQGTIPITAGSIMENAIFVRFNIPDTAPPCQIRYLIDVEKEGQSYVSAFVDLIIIGE
jgi:hypothetical protein